MSNRTLWGVAAAAVAAAVAAALVTARPATGEGGTHPEPRPGVTAQRVMADAAIPRTPGSMEAYAAARLAPATLDGSYCHCDCSKHAGHRSLLTCFESEHGAYCDICMGEAVLASQLAARGTSLQEIRAAIDRQFGT